jgi:predicted DNA-binding transcriptional regulator YafY
MGARTKRPARDMSQAARVVRMIRTLCARGMTRAELSEAFDIHPRQVYRYLQEIERLGYLFEDHAGGGERVWKIEGGYQGIKPEPATDQELMSFYLAKNHLAYLNGTPFVHDLESLGRKIEAGLPTRTANKIERLVQVFLPAQRPQRSYAAQREALAALQKALLYQRPARILHQALGYPKPAAHRFDPYALRLHNYGLYLGGYSHRAKDFRWLAVERIREVTVDMTADPFELRPACVRRMKSERAFGMIEEPLLPVRVQFHRDIADYFKERQWHPTQRVQRVKNGDVVVSLEAGGVEEIASWVLSWGGYAKVLGPPELRDEVRRHLAEAQAQYG